MNFFDDTITQHFFRVRAMISPKDLPTRNAMRDKLMAQFSIMKENLKDILQSNDSRFSFTLDAWTAKNGSSYYGITIHFINKD